MYTMDLSLVFYFDRAKLFHSTHAVQILSIIYIQNSWKRTSRLA